MKSKQPRNNVLDNCPELRKAVAHAKRSGATPVVAKLERLLRSTVVCGLLTTSGVKFVICAGVLNVEPGVIVSVLPLTETDATLAFPGVAENVGTPGCEPLTPAPGIVTVIAPGAASSVMLLKELL